MSKIADFYSKVMADEALHSKLKEILGDTSIAEASDEVLEKIGALAKEAGYDITLAEAKEYLSANEVVVSDEALDAVAGGEARGKSGPPSEEEIEKNLNPVHRIIKKITD